MGYSVKLQQNIKDSLKISSSYRKISYFSHCFSIWKNKASCNKNAAQHTNERKYCAHALKTLWLVNDF